jgi:hypothetical protein
MIRSSCQEGLAQTLFSGGGIRLLAVSMWKLPLGGKGKGSAKTPGELGGMWTETAAVAAVILALAVVHSS